MYDGVVLIFDISDRTPQKIKSLLPLDNILYLLSLVSLICKNSANFWNRAVAVDVPQLPGPFFVCVVQ